MCECRGRLVTECRPPDVHRQWISSTIKVIQRKVMTHQRGNLQSLHRHPALFGVELPSVWCCRRNNTAIKSLLEGRMSCCIRQTAAVDFGVGGGLQAWHLLGWLPRYTLLTWRTRVSPDVHAVSAMMSRTHRSLSGPVTQTSTTTPQLALVVYCLPATARKWLFLLHSNQQSRLLSAWDGWRAPSRKMVNEIFQNAHPLVN